MTKLEIAFIVVITTAYTVGCAIITQRQCSPTPTTGQTTKPLLNLLQPKEIQK